MIKILEVFHVEKMFSNFPPDQGLYSSRQEKDSCGVGFLVNIDGTRTHSVLSQASTILCNMLHRGSSPYPYLSGSFSCLPLIVIYQVLLHLTAGGGTDQTDGDGAGVMTGIPHELFGAYFAAMNITPPLPGQYATGNVFFRHFLSLSNS